MKDTYTLIILISILLISFTEGYAQINSEKSQEKDWSEWQRPVDQPVFTTEHGNNHDAMLFVDHDLPYPYHIIVSHSSSVAHLWRSKKISWNSKDWELVSDQYKIGDHYEYNDAVKVNGIYYIFESGDIYSYEGTLEEANGKWEVTGHWPTNWADDVGIYYEDGIFHLFGEYGNYPHGYDGTSLAHITSTDLQHWKMMDTKAVDPNPRGGKKYGVGDATITKINGTYYLYCDRESRGSPYKVVGWKTKDLSKPFEYIGIVIKPRSNQTDDWDNYRIQDADISYLPAMCKYVMVCNLKDKDGNPGPEAGNFGNVHLEGKETRVVGFFCSKDTLCKTENE